MPRHRVDLAEVREVVTALAAFTEFQDDLLARVRAEAHGTMQVWSGSAQASFLEQYERWAQAAARMSAAAVRIQQLADNAHAHYDAAASMNRSVWL